MIYIKRLIVALTIILSLMLPTVAIVVLSLLTMPHPYLIVAIKVRPGFEIGGNVTWDDCTLTVSGGYSFNTDGLIFDRCAQAIVRQSDQMIIFYW